MILNAVNDQFSIGQSPSIFRITPSVVSDADGNFIAVWASEDQDGDSFGIFGQRFQSDGSPIGPEFQVNTFT